MLGPKMFLIGVILATTVPSQRATAETLKKRAVAPEITLKSLFDEMCHADALARYPVPAYRQLQASSYNRKSVARDQPEQDTSGWFADSDGVSWIREEMNDGRKEWVIMEHEGPGCVTRIWTPYFYYRLSDRVGPRIRIYLDGSAQPVIDETLIELLTRNDWPNSYGPRPPRTNGLEIPSPMADFTARAGDLYLPIPFARHCKITLDSKAFYNIVNYRAYRPATKVRSFTLEEYHAARRHMTETGAVLERPANLDTSRPFIRRALTLARDEITTIALPHGPAAVHGLMIELDPAQIASDPSLLRSTVLAGSFDGEQTIWCPVGDFFGSANRINPFHTWMRTVTSDGHMICRWVMPYRATARITLKNLADVPVRVVISVQTRPWTWDQRSMHFHASWRSDDVLAGDQFADWNFVDIRGRGVLVGDQWTVLNLTDGWWGEGDEKIYVDASYDVRKFPDHFGTGTEDYYGWAGGVNPTRHDIFDHPFLANISVGSTMHSSTRGFNICTRLRSLDAIPFTSRLRFDMEASPGTGQRRPWNLLGYSAVTWWYGSPGATCNRPPLPVQAAQPLISLASLQERAEKKKAQSNRDNGR